MNEGLTRKIIGIIDDQPDVASLYARVITSMGHDISIFHDAIDLRDRMNEDPQLRYDLVVSDIVMPKMDGIQFARYLHARNPETPLVLVTGYSNGYDSSSLPPNVRGVLLKPFPLSELKAVISRNLPREEPAKQAV